MSDKRQLTPDPLDGFDPEVGAWLWAFQDTRQRTLEALAGLDDETVNWPAPDGSNSISTLLYHLAAIEADWLLEEILAGADFPPEFIDLLIYDVRDDAGHLVSVIVEPLETHLERLARVRAYFLTRIAGMTREDFHRPRRLERYDVSPAWVIHHLIQHEAEHRGQIGEIRGLAEKALGKK